MLNLVSTFNQDSISSVTHSVELSISHKTNSEIKIYLWGGLLPYSLGHMELSLWTLFKLDPFTDLSSWLFFNDLDFC